MGTQTTDPLALIGTTLEGKYAIESYVAKGGFGVVYRGTHLRLRRPVAVKLLRLDQKVGAEQGRLIREEFEVEGRNVAQLDHPAIVRVMDFGVSEVRGEADVPWMVSEWMDGKTLAADLKARRGEGGRSPRECLMLLKPVLEALSYAHELRIVHRDIKPANLMFTGAEAGGGRSASRVGVPLLKLLDFGIAKVMEPDEVASSGETQTRSQTISFSTKYGAPEQFSGARTGPWTDVHAMALIFTEVLTDRPPYEGREAMDFHLEAMSPRRPTPGRYGVDVGAWEPVLAKALALRPADRYASIAAFLAALEAAVPDGAHADARPAFGGAPRASIEQTDGAAINTSTAPPVTSQTASERVQSSARTRAAAVVGAVALTLGVVFVVVRAGGDAPVGPPRPAASVATAAAAMVEAPTRVEAPPAVAPSAIAPSVVDASVAQPALAAPNVAPVDAGARRRGRRHPTNVPIE